MIDISKPHQTRDGRKVFDLELLDNPVLMPNGDVAFVGGRVMNKEGRGEYYRWTSDGASTFDSQLDLIPEKRMKETAVTADQAKKVMEYNMNIDEDKLLGFARSHILAAQRICSQVGFMFDKLVDETRNKDRLIRMDRKYRTRNGGKVRIVCTDGPGEQPVVGFVSGEIGVNTWDAFGKYMKTYESGLDLILDEEGENR